MNLDLSDPKVLEFLKNEFDQLLAAPKSSIQTVATQAFIDYAASTIMSRAIPSILDGLKPVHRRILMSLKDLHLYPATAHKKSAKIVGHALGSYHPHGDTAVYEAMIALAQPWMRNLPLVDGQGNFGSSDKDMYAAMRYTEAKLTKYGMLFFQDIDKEVVDIIPNYDSTEEEYSVLPVPYPNLLINGSFGISTGLTTSVPLHNPNEVMDLLLHMIKLRKKGKEVSTQEILSFIPSPDFPSGGVIYDNKEMEKIIETGQGFVKLRATYEIEKVTAQKQALIITSLPYNISRTEVINEVVSLVKEKKLQGIATIRDESEKQDTRIYIELKQGTDICFTWNYLLKHTKIDQKVKYCITVIHNNAPKIVSFKEIFETFINFRLSILVKKNEYLKKAYEKRIHILEGLLLSLEKIDLVISILKTSEDQSVAVSRLMKELSLSERQSDAILELKMQKLIGLERLKLEKEKQDLESSLSESDKILSSEDLRLDIIFDETKKARKEISKERCTLIDIQQPTVEKIDVIKKENCLVTLTKKMYIRRSDKNKDIELQENDFITNTFETNTHEVIMCVTKKGQVFSSRICDIEDTPKGRFIENVFSLPEGDHVIKILKIEDFNDSEIIFISRAGFVKKSLLKDYEGSLRSTGISGVKVDEDDIIVDVFIPSKQEIILISSEGMLIKFDKDEVPVMGRSSRGVIGMKTSGLIFGGSVEDWIVFYSNNVVKSVKTENYSSQKRAGKGLTLSKNDIDIATSISNESVLLYTGETYEEVLVDSLVKGLKTKNISEIYPKG